MKRLSLQWRITLMTAALIGVTCVLMNCLIGYSGKRYMDAIGSGISAYSEIESGAPDAFDPQSKQPDDELTIIISGAQAAFGADIATINPYLGVDGIKPFTDACRDNGTGVFVLVKTSNPSSGQLQDLRFEDGRTLYQAVADLVEEWGEETRGESGYSAVGAVVGATYPAQLGEMREKAPHTFFLVPGYGAQGGGADDVAPAFDKNGLGAIINSSRGIMCAWQKEKCDEHDYAQAARREAIRMRDEICARIGEIRANG